MAINPYNYGYSNPYYNYNTQNMQNNVNNSYNPSPISLNNIVIGIQGLDAAKAYPLAPNTRGYFFDMEKDYVYIKEIGPDGVQKNPIDIYKCTKVTEESLKEPAIGSTPTMPENVVTVDKIESIIQNYLDAHSYKPYIPKNQRRDMAQNGQIIS